MMNLVKNKFLRTFLFATGWLCVTLGIAGIFLPLLPTTPFVLLAAWCFVRSSKKAHDWIYGHPVFGKALTDWEQSRSIAPKTKAVAVTTIVLSLVIIWLKVKIDWVKIPVTLLLTVVSVFILTRKSTGAKKN